MWWIGRRLDRQVCASQPDVRRVCNTSSRGTLLAAQSLSSAREGGANSAGRLRLHTCWLTYGNGSHFFLLVPRGVPQQSADDCPWHLAPRSVLSVSRAAGWPLF